MTAPEVLAAAHLLGITLRAEGQSILYSPQSAMTRRLAEAIRTLRPQLLALLSGEPVAATPTTISAVTRLDRTAPGGPPAAPGTVLLAPAGDRPHPDRHLECPTSGYDTRPRRGKSPSPICKCGSRVWVDVPIHGGRGRRRDCGQCRAFVEFSAWNGVPSTSVER